MRNLKQTSVLFLFLLSLIIPSTLLAKNISTNSATQTLPLRTDVVSMHNNQDLVAHYSFENGNANDHSGNGYHGAIVGDPVVVSGVNGDALRLDGVNDFISLSEEMATDYVSVSAWVKTTSDKAGPENKMYLIRLRYWGYGITLNSSDPGRVGGGVHTVCNNEMSDYRFLSNETNYNNGEWHHIALTYGENSGFRFYIDGVLKHEDDSNYGSPICHASGGGYSIGRDGNHQSDYFEGAIDELRIYRRALTYEEVLGLYLVAPPQFDLPFNHASIGPETAFLSRTTSVFDHDLPLSFGSEDGNDKVVSYLGIPLVSSTASAISSYDQHNGYDFSGRQIADRKVRAPSAGAITYGYDAQKLYECELPGRAVFLTRSCLAEIDHGNGWKTRFLHLAHAGGTDRNPVCLVDRSKRLIKRSAVIGGVGNTGCSTKSHIHMEVLKDGVVFDPSGWQGGEQNTDPWEEHPTGTKSFAMWKFSVPIPESWVGIDGVAGAQIISSRGTIIDIPPREFLGQWAFEYLDVPVAEPSNGLLPAGHSFILKGSQATQYSLVLDSSEGNLSITIPYSSEEIANIHEDTLGLYWWNKDSELWEATPTELDSTERIAISRTDRFGLFALLGEDADYYQFLPVVR